MTPDGVDPARAARLAAMVTRATGGSIARIESLAPGLGLRRFLRIHVTGGAPSRLVARFEAPEEPTRRPTGLPPEPPLESLRTLLEEHGLPVPRSFGHDADAGIDLLEDAGPRSLGTAVAACSEDERRDLYSEACDLVPRLQRVRDDARGVAAFGRRLDAAYFRYKADFFATWALPMALGREATAAERSVVDAAFAWVADVAHDAPARLAHRDLQSANIHVREGAPAGKRLVLLDLQGAFLAPPEYDLVCLLRDSYVELTDVEVAQQLARVRAQLPDAPDSDAFGVRFDLLTLTRKGKDLALYLQSARTRGLTGMLAFVPAAVRAVRTAAARRAGDDPRLARLGELIAMLPEQPRVPEPLRLPESLCGG